MADESEMRWMPILYGLTAGLSSLLIVEMFVWIFHFRGGFAWQADPEHQFNWHPLLMTISLVVLYGHGNFNNSSSSSLCLNKLKRFNS